MIARHGPGTPQTYHIFMSHVHWDHIMGFPFFVPAYIPGNRDPHLRRPRGARGGVAPAAGAAVVSRWSSRRCGADIEFVQLEPGKPYDVAGMHGDARCCSGTAATPTATASSPAGRTVIYSTDSEHKLETRTETERFVDFFRDADVVIFDAMYSLAEAISVKADWGHSSNIVGVELCQMAGARHLCLFHHEPANDDAALDRLLRGNAPLRGDHARRRSAACQRRLRRDGNRVVNGSAAPPPVRRSVVCTRPHLRLLGAALCSSALAALMWLQPRWIVDCSRPGSTPTSC